MRKTPLTFFVKYAILCIEKEKETMMTKKELNSTHQRATELTWGINALSDGVEDARHVSCQGEGCVVEISVDSTLLAFQLCDIVDITGLNLEAVGEINALGYIPFLATKRLSKSVGIMS